MDIASLALPAETFTPWKPAPTQSVTSFPAHLDATNTENITIYLINVCLVPPAYTHMLINTIILLHCERTLTMY